ncbi:MAG: glycosyltransferase [Anaerolineae bacterium]|nr:glycosyltransferase [Anaerolineae bacterium]
MTEDILSFFIGYDGREHDAYQVCRATLLKHATIPVHVQPLDERALRHNGLYRREWVSENGQRFDKRDGRPFSTEFSFTRFLIPSLMQWQGWAIFCDCDFLFLTDVAELERQLDPMCAVMCCKQVYTPTSDTKMDGVIQQKYYRKNWSSFMAFNCEHKDIRMLTPHVVNKESGAWLHAMSWVSDANIGDLDHGWNWIEGTTNVEPKAVHFTMGGPWFPHMQNVKYADKWREEASLLGIRVQK